MERENPPVESGEIVNGTVEGQGEKGDAIIRVEGYVLFVDADVDIGDEITAKVTNTMSNFGFAELTE